MSDLRISDIRSQDLKSIPIHLDPFVSKNLLEIFISQGSLGNLQISELSSQTHTQRSISILKALQLRCELKNKGGGWLVVALAEEHRNHDRCWLSLASPGTVTGNGRPSIASAATENLHSGQYILSLFLFLFSKYIISFSIGLCLS